MVEVGKQVKATLPNGKVFEGKVTSALPLFEGGLTGAAGLFHKYIGERYTVECPTCSHRVQVDVCSTIEVVEEVQGG